MYNLEIGPHFIFSVTPEMLQFLIKTCSNSHILLTKHVSKGGDEAGFEYHAVFLGI